MVNIRQGYTFDDLLLVPKYSKIKTRSEVDTSVNLGKGVKLQIPIISANMKNVTGHVMANKIAKLGGLPILHRFHDNDSEYIAEWEKTENLCKKNQVALSIGVNKNSLILLDTFMHLYNRPMIVCIDVAHGDSVFCIETAQYVKQHYPDVLLIAGNVATGEGAVRLRNAGVDVIKVGVGPGSLCTTRVETGNGVPQLTALMDIREKLPDAKIIADGGIKNSGDCIKALCFADAVMLGNLLAGTDEAPGEVISVDGLKYKQYAGSSTHKTSHVEGVVGLAPYKGSVENIINRLMEGIRSGMSYQGVSSLTQLKDNPEFISISNAGLKESKPHSIRIKE